MSPGSSRHAASAEEARRIAVRVRDPELPMLTLEDLGVLRGVEVVGGCVIVTLTPTYSGCPALATMRDDVVHRLHNHGFLEVEVRISLDPPWSSDDITPKGRRALVEAGISAPGPAPDTSGPVPLSLLPTHRAVTCPQCGAADAVLTSEFGATACKALYRCTECLEPFEHIKEI
ncbi:1,2-phenylacetyl-CoA epoxidase subunit PaaD [Nocardioides sp.]|uniref:1,2-phenylacetyl-CoA epoxidase subunit PaaD n=1 Tax=Nocardioides sp. TaxID=35761 RepID=UPI002B26B9F7|nr:1,2-phenylacetyl-CoA epoxidase subunit PaaD [Nocardioides sp.]